jgi:hypothetical protein
VEYYISGSKYEGEFKNNYRHGKGLLLYLDGTRYEGDFVRGMPYGFGIQITKSRNRIRCLKTSIAKLAEKDAGLT